MKNRRFLALFLIFALCAGAALASEISMSPEDVYALEARLSALGYLTREPNQTFDDDTRQALACFQQANGLSVTGAADADSVAKLGDAAVLSRQDYLRRFAEETQTAEPLKPGDIKNQVATLQRRLIEYGYFKGEADGVFGDATRGAVERFQMVNGLPVTGIADGMTLMRLMADVPITWQGFLSEMSCATGDAGLNVYVLQRKLDVLGDYDGECTGSFGDLTKQAVTRFQQDNALEPTGTADASLWELLYSGVAVSRRRTDVVQRGDAGENVTKIQERLSVLGYLAREHGERYDYATETAVRLFQMANELTVTGRVGGDTLGTLLGNTAKPLGDATVKERFAALMGRRDAELQARIAETAASLVGAEFAEADDPLYPGFAFVQYVCVAAGLPVTTPEALIRLADDPVENLSEAEAGNVVVFQMADSDSVNMLMTISAGEGRVIHASPEIGWVVMTYADQIDSESVYRWTER